MPVFAYAIIGGVVLFMVIFMPLMIRKNMAKAKQGTQNMLDGLQRLGLQVSKQEASVTRLDGQYRGRKVAMFVDGSAVAKVGKKAMMGSLLAGAKGLAGAADLSIGGFDVGGGSSSSAVKKSRKLKNAMQNAAMVIKWAVVLPLESPVAVQVSKGEEDGSVAIGSGLHATFDEPARAGLTNPQVVASLSNAHFDVINIEGKKVMCAWAPPMKEYQKVAVSSEAFAHMSEQSMNALCDMCDALYGPTA